MDKYKIFIGNIIHCSEPFKTVQIYGFVIATDKIIALGKLSSLDDYKKTLGIEAAEVITLTNSQILIPGLIDTHIHAPQYPNAGLGYDKTLLDWLNDYTYKIETKYKDMAMSERVYDAIVRKTLSFGTTTACYFASLYPSSSLILVDCALKYGQRALVGKINMITFSPDDYIESREASITDTLEFVKTVLAFNNHLVQPIITPRFALTVDIELMKELAKIATKYNLHIQSHISENKDEISMVEDVYKTDYATAYDRGELLTSKTILAHGVHLTDSEIKLLKERGTSISHCPASNTCLQSGLCDARRLIDSGITVGLGTDVSGGPTVSIMDAMRSAINTSVHISYEKQDCIPLTYLDAFYLATLGGAKALSLDKNVGNFEVGKEFDALILDMDVDGSSCDYLVPCSPLELLQKFVYLGDDRNVIGVFVCGKKLK